jgi:ribokinase
VTTVAVYGSVNWDEICQLPRYPGEHEKIDALAIDSALGGSGANTATWLAPRVARVELLGAVGDDPEGRLCLQWLEAAGVGRDDVEIIERGLTSRASCWIVGADKRIVTYRQPGLRREHATEAALATSATAGHLHLGSTIDAAGLECLTAARGAGASISIELSSRSHDEVRPHAELVFLNTEELRGNFGLAPDRLDADAVARVVPKRGATLVITNGSESIICATTESVEHFPVTPLAHVVDRTGGGDAFDAGFIAGWLERGRDLGAAVASGLECSRAVLQQLGGARRPTASA